MLDENWITRRQAARAVGRSLNTIRRWQRQGMPSRLIEGQTYVEESIVFQWKRERLEAWPVHQYRMRKILAESDSRHAETPDHT